MRALMKSPFLLPCWMKFAEFHKRSLLPDNLHVLVFLHCSWVHFWIVDLGKPGIVLDMTFNSLTPEFYSLLAIIV